MSDSTFLRTSSLLGPCKQITKLTKQGNSKIICHKHNLKFNSDIFNLHLVPMNLPVETANEVVEIIITVA